LFFELSLINLCTRLKRFFAISNIFSHFKENVGSETETTSTNYKEELIKLFPEEFRIEDAAAIMDTEDKSGGKVEVNSSICRKF